MTDSIIADVSEQIRALNRTLMKHGANPITGISVDHDTINILRMDKIFHANYDNRGKGAYSIAGVPVKQQQEQS